MSIVGVAFPLVVLGGPILLGMIGFFRSRGAILPSPGPAWDWRLTAASTLFYVLAFNLVFFVQELFLVLPKAMVPGLDPTLFHNNHNWSGKNPIAELLQGTGALATVAVALVCAALLSHRPGRSTTLRLLLIWLTFHGAVMALAQVVVGALVPQNDVGRAMTWLQFGEVGKTTAALLALAVIVAVAVWLTPCLLGLAGRQDQIDDAGRRTGFIFRVGTLPALIGTLLIIPYRVPGHIIEVAVVPAAVAVIGIGWIQAGAWRVEGARAHPDRSPVKLWPPFAALVAVLLIFQIVLRPGIAFY